MNIEALEVVVELMALRERMGTGLFVALGIVWYLIAPESLDCTDMETGETLEGCVEFLSIVDVFLCTAAARPCRVLPYSEQKEVSTNHPFSTSRLMKRAGQSFLNMTPSRHNKNRQRRSSARA